MPIPPLSAEEAEALERQASDLLSAFCRIPNGAQPSEQRWEPERPIVASFDQETIVGHIASCAVDPITGAVIGRTLAFRGNAFSLDAAGCRLLEHLADRWRSIPSLTGLTTTASLVNRVLNWCAAALQSKIPVACVPHFLQRFDADLREHEVWIQVPGIDVQGRVTLGKVELCEVSSAVITRWMEKARENGVDDAAREGAHRAITMLWQGQTAAVYRGDGDTDAVHDRGIEQAERTCALIRAMAPQSCSALGRSFLQPITLDSQGHLRATFMDPETVGASDSRGPRDGLHGVPDGLVITQENWPHLWEDGQLRYVHELLAEDSPSRFQRALTQSLLVYSRQRLTTDPVEKVIMTMAALEGLLSPGHVKKRLTAALAGSNAFKEYVEHSFEDANRIRNKFLHHGLSLRRVHDVERFLQVAWLFYRRALPQHAAWKVTHDFLSALDDTYRDRFGKSSGDPM
jgi:hypothetical protein